MTLSVTVREVYRRQFDAFIDLQPVRSVVCDEKM